MRDDVWMDGTPVAVADASGAAFVHADGLDTPRAVTNASGTLMWTWAYRSNLFGELAPTSTGDYMLNLRFPGQYADAESGLNYNLSRDYDTASGRYIQSDPIGMQAGVSTYTYVEGSPLVASDPTGMSKVQGSTNIGGNDPLTPRLNAASDPAEVKAAIKAAREAVDSGELSPGRLKNVRGWLKVAKRGFVRSECPPLFFNILEEQMGALCEQGNPIGCSMYEGLGGTVTYKDKI